MDDLSAILSLFERNVNKLHTNLSAYQAEIDALRQTLLESWAHVGRADNRIISVHDCLLSGVNEVNEYIIKLNLHISLNREVGIFKNVDARRSQNSCKVESINLNGSKRNHTNLDGIEVGDLDAHSVDKHGEDHTADALPVEVLNQSNNATNQKSITTLSPRLDAKPENISIPTACTMPKLPIPARKSKLLPPLGGRQMSCNETYARLLKNTSNFRKGSVTQATMMHLNIAENSIFVAKWGQASMPLKKLLACQMAIQELNRLPDFGKIFAVYDAQEQIIPRVLINAYTKGGGYDAYLLDYGEHIHLDGDEVIFALPSELQKMPAEAIRCCVRNRNVANIRQFIYKDVRFRVLENNGNDLEVEFLDDGQAEEEGTLTNTTKPKINQQMNNSLKLDSSQKKNQPKKTDHKLENSALQISPADMEMLNDFEQGTSDAVKAVLGFNPTDDQRICRHYDPKIKSCFKGSNCRLLHQPFAPHGATKDTELVDALPDTNYISAPPRSLGSVVRVLVTFIQSPIQVYVQFIDETPTPPLVWSKKDVPESQCKFKRAPRMLDKVRALYSDGCYYRAQIIEEIDGMFKIFYVDYGNTEFVTIASLAQCSDAVSLKPHRANSCFIGGVKHSALASREQNAECVEFLKSKILNAEFDVLLISHVPDGYVVKLLDPYADVLKHLIKRGYVEPSTDNLEYGDNNVVQFPKKVDREATV